MANVTPNFSASVVTGNKLLQVRFNDESATAVAITIIQYLWDFGDGRTSTDKNPIHIYRMPGIYTVTLEVWDNYGNYYKETKVAYIKVYDYDFINDTINAANTDETYRVAVEPMQGKGIVPYGGDHWIYPTAYTGTCKGFDKNGECLSLICDNRNGRFYRIGIPELWTDRTDSYGGYEIPGSFKLKKRTARSGEYEQFEHVESHLHIRPWKETYRDQSGYTDEGFRDAHSIDIKIYENGNHTTESAKLEDSPRYGDKIFRKRIEARELQEEYLFTTAAWRVIKTQELYMPIDKAAGPAFDYPSESQWQDEFRGSLLWLSRDRLRPTINRSTGTALTGSYDSLATGPDGQSNSAIEMAVTDSLTDTLASMSGNFTLSMWLYGMTTFPGVVFQTDTGNLLISISEIAGIRSILFNDGVNGWSRQLDWLTGWVHLAVVRDGATLRIYENGSSIFSNAMVDDSISYGGSTIISNGIIATLFDVRVIEKAISASAIAYYYDQIINNGRQCPFLPIIR